MLRCKSLVLDEIGTTFIVNSGKYTVSLSKVVRSSSSVF